MNNKQLKPSFFSGLTGQILIAMVLGAILGIVIQFISPEAAHILAKLNLANEFSSVSGQNDYLSISFTTICCRNCKISDIKAVEELRKKYRVGFLQLHSSHYCWVCF
jgi:L-cystine uptake protein TcyP (sodium:dicarboxylate symporter family)